MAELLELPASTYAAYEDRAKFKKKLLPIELARKIADVLENHDIQRAEVLKLAGLTAEGEVPAKPEDIARDLGITLVPELELGYSMGGGAVFSDFRQTGVVPFHRDWLRSIMRGSFGDLFVARGSGDSMQPTLLDGDVVLIDTSQKAITQQDRIWAVSYGDLAMIKRVRRLPDGAYQLNSDNPAVSPIHAVDGEMHVVGRVIWIGRRI